MYSFFFLFIKIDYQRTKENGGPIQKDASVLAESCFIYPSQCVCVRLLLLLFFWNFEIFSLH